nr:hypothetical protein [Suaeda aralocaspica]
MPLTELVRMFKGKVDVTQEEASGSTDLTPRLDTDCLELVWENGQIMMQGKAKRNPASNSFQTFGLRPQDGRNGSGSKMTKFGAIDSMMGDFPLAVPSCEMGLDHDVDLVPWLSYQVEESLHNEYTSDFLHELSGVTINDLPSDNQLAYRERKGSFQGDGHVSSVSLKNCNTYNKASSRNEKDDRGGSGEVPQFVLPLQNNVPRSGISDVTYNYAGNVHHVASRDSVLNPSSLSAFTSLRLQKLDAVQPSTSSGFTNFPYFSRPGFTRANHATVNPSKGFENDEIRCNMSSSNPTHSTLLNLDSGCSQKEIVSHNQSIVAPANGNSKALLVKPTGEPHSVSQTMCREDIANNHVLEYQASDATMRKVGTNNGNKIVEPVVAASSVCSGNSAERASNEPARNLKRKSHEIADSDNPSDEVEEESVGAKKPVHGRNGSKRSRAAEVHNLSERKRRDRINEKMRALQELIPNCNKADKASMLDEAIDYLKTLQLQVQIMSMGAGLYMQPMMLPPGMQPIHGAHMPHFSPMNMGMGMGFGMNMINMNNGTKMVPFQGPQYPVPGTQPSFQGMPGSNLQAFAHPGQGSPMHMQQAPVATAPMPGSHLKMTMGSNASDVCGSSNAPHLAPSSSKKDASLQMMSGMGSNSINNSKNQGTNQASNECNQQTALHHDRPQTVNALETADPANAKDAKSC